MPEDSRVARVALSSVFGLVTLAAIASAQSPAPFAWTDLAIPSTNAPFLAIGDVDGDGALDLIVPAPQPYVLRNDGNGYFVGQPALGGPAGAAQPSAIADFDGDGRADLAMISSGTLTVWFGAAPGILVAAQPI